MKPQDKRIIEECAAKAAVRIVHMCQRKKHYKVIVYGNRPGVVFVSISPSDFRAYKNVVTDMKKVGYEHV